MSVLSVEKACGIEVFLTKTKGIGGKLRTTPEDFIVQEQYSYPKAAPDGNITIAEITSTSWETHHLANELSKKLHISRMRIGFAGTKDKRAQTTQLISFYNVLPEAVANITLKDVTIKNIYRSNRAVHIGELHGNQFHIRIRDIDARVSSQTLESCCSLLHKHGGFPNFFGIQRFGIMRPITHIV
jgi:tRNA pseudouridine13 synthase